MITKGNIGPDRPVSEETLSILPFKQQAWLGVLG